jgi:hypothetical protein
MKKTGSVYKGPAKPKADVTIILSDEVFTQLAQGKVRALRERYSSATNLQGSSRAKWPKGLYDWQTEDKGQYDACD